MTVKGVDISGANGNVDFAMLKRNGISFVMINLGNNFADNVKKAEAAGMHWGAYYYTYSLNAAEDKEELNKILGRLAGKKPTYPVAIDVEDADGYKKRNGGWNYSNVNRNAKYLLEGLAKAGYYPMIYTGFEEIENYLSKDGTPYTPNPLYDEYMLGDRFLFIKPVCSNEAEPYLDMIVIQGDDIDAWRKRLSLGSYDEQIAQIRKVSKPFAEWLTR